MRIGSVIFILCVGVSNLHAQPQSGAPGAFTGGLPDWAKSSWRLRRQTETTLLLEQGQIVNVITGEVSAPTNILIAGDEILSIGNQKPEGNVKTIDAGGTYLI